MTKKHFIALADAIRERISTLQIEDATVNAAVRYELQALTEAIADVCADSNPAFKRERWLGYIAGSNGKNGGVRKAKREYQPKTGQACGCRPGMQRDNCPQCEGTGQRIDFAAIRGAR